MKDRIKLFDPVIGMKEERVVKNILKSRFWASGAGAGNVAKFEQEFKEYTSTKECIAVNSGTAALHLALSIPEIKGKEVIVPSLSFVATAHAVVYNGAKPVFADIDPCTLCIDPDSIRKLITKKTRVILPVHFAGMPANLIKIDQICKESKCDMIEDAAHAAGSTYNKQKIGTHGLAVCFSYHPVKNLAMPTGGAITLNGNKATNLKKILNSRRWCGISDRVDWNYDVKDIGWNYYMNEFSAAIGRIQLKKLDQLNKKRKNIARQYFNKIQVDKKMLFDEDCSYHFYWIFVKNREQFMKKLKKQGIETGIHYNPIHKMTFYKESSKLPNTEKLANGIVSLPTHPNLTEGDVIRIIDLVNKYA
jgi:dTDP-4-amino-4,6-dideoxygalactose transaminase